MSEYNVWICVYRCPKCGHRNVVAHVGCCAESRFFCPRCGHKKRCELQLRVATNIYELVDKLVSLGVSQCDVALYPVGVGDSLDELVRLRDVAIKNNDVWLAILISLLIRERILEQLKRV